MIKIAPKNNNSEERLNQLIEFLIKYNKASKSSMATKADINQISGLIT